jgi:CARDB
MDYKEILIYVILAIVIIAAVVFVLNSSMIFKSSTYNIKVSILGDNGSTVYPYQTSHFVVNVTNAGGAQVNGLLVGIYLNGIEQNESTVDLPAGKSITITKNYTYQYPGPFTFEAVADPGDLLPLANRSAAQSSITTNVAFPQVPNVYISIPNTNIIDTQSFTLNGGGAISASAVAQRYNISIVNKLFGPGETVSAKIYQDVYPYTANVYGAYAAYTNNTIAYSAWMSGTLDPQFISSVISSFGIKILQVNTPKQDFEYAKISNTTSMCLFYNGGWTKLVDYYNASVTPQTCANIVVSTYVPSETNTIVNLHNNNTMLSHLQSKFFYTNSTIGGSALEFTANNVTLTNIFENGFGVFISSVKHVLVPLNITGAKNSTCYGLIYSNNGVNMCSYAIPTRTYNYSLQYGLINSSYITSNYIINMYSLVNGSELVAAHENAGDLFSALNVSGKSINWQLSFKNSCVFENSSIGCKFVSFDYKNNTAFFNITNKLSRSIKINQLNCELNPGFPNVTINKTIAANGTLAIGQYCNVVPETNVAAQSIYELILNYTYNNVTKIAIGNLNVTNQALT